LDGFLTLEPTPCLTTPAQTPLKIFERKGSFCVGHAIQRREHSLLWQRIGNRKNAAPNDSDSDVQLLERLKQRDEHAFLRLYDRHGQSVYRFLMLMTGSVAIAEDLTQEAFVVILNAMCSGSIGQFNPAKGTLEGYLLGIARNLARAERRRAHRMLPLDNVVETPEWERLLRVLFQENKTLDALDLLTARSELRALNRAILELPSHYREVVVLCSLQERSYHEAAALLQCSEGTIASRMNRAKALLAAKLRRSPSVKMNASVT
jgi:RNA polymerase sigma-70 factor, ECF subfamily